MIQNGSSLINQFEFGWIRGTEFFPARPATETLLELEEICIATRYRSLGDALVLTSLPAALKRQYPNLKRVSTYPRGFNPVAFQANPHVGGLNRAPPAVYGDEAFFGGGHVIDTKLAFFGIDPKTCPPEDRRPRLWTSDAEKMWARHDLIEHHSYMAFDLSKPLCIIHPWGISRNRVLKVEDWDALVKELSKTYRVWQVGLENDSAVQGCDYYFLQRRSWTQLRKLFAVIEKASLFVGVDSGPMHVARAFSIPSVILVNHVDPDAVMSGRREGRAITDPIQRLGAFLYDENAHLFANKLDRRTLINQVSALAPKM